LKYGQNIRDFLASGLEIKCQQPKTQNAEKDIPDL
jgi:hypothetical protein